MNRPPLELVAALIKASVDRPKTPPIPNTAPTVQAKDAPAKNFAISYTNPRFKNWKELMNNLASPIHSTGYTIYFRNIGELSKKLHQQVASYIEDTQMSQRHKIISSSQRDLSLEVINGRFSSKLYLLLSGFVINIPELKHRKQDIPALINILLSQYNVMFGKSAIGIEPDAMNLLVNFDWPLNLLHLEKVVRQLVASSSSLFIFQKGKF